MTAPERRASTTLALVFALRMMGLFLVLPVFALEAPHYTGGDDPTRVGIAIGLYGLTQALLQMPLGLASDRWGRRPVIVGGMLVFTAGSFAAATADSIWGLMLGRALQGAGAVSAATMALLADLTRESVRTKAMAMIGASIGLVFALALAVAPLLAAWWGLPGIFMITGALALLATVAVVWLVPTPSAQTRTAPPTTRTGVWHDALTKQASPLRDLWGHPDVLRLNAGVFLLHTIQMAMWVIVPALLVRAGLAQSAHWQFYLPIVTVAFLSVGALFALERRGLLRIAMLSCIALIALVQLGLLVLAGNAQTPPALWALVVLMLLFFIAFNTLEASQPSLLSRLAPAHLRGAALGAYNTLQALGLFAGGALGGALLQWAQQPWALFGVTTLLAALWLAMTWPLRVPTPA